MDPIIPHEDSSTLENTNRLLSDLERKLSFVSTASSNQTQQSQGSSVIINKSGKQNVQSSVLQYMKNDDDHFNPNDLFQERQQKFLTKFGKHYNDDNSRMLLPSETSPNNWIHGKIDIIDVDDPVGISDEDMETFTYENRKDEVNGDESNADEEKHEMFGKENEMFDKDEMFDTNENKEGDDKVNEDDFYDEDILLPPSPPRSPPREIDPGKLYGLYDFSGPDPSHCTLSREEPVFLINDLDNYWWLIRKMTKLERILHSKKTRVYHDDDDGQDHENHDISDDEDGKIGFVPAECLETYGERLARLNCFKNEELERTSRDNIIETSSHDDISTDTFDIGLIDLAHPINYHSVSQIFNSQDLIVSRGNSMNKSNSLLRRIGSKKNNKSVTFESLAELGLNEEENPDHQDDIEYIRDQQKKGFSHTFYDVAHDEISKEKNVPEERISEVLSDIYPNETPLVINKNSKSKSKTKSLTSSLTSPRSPIPSQPPPPAPSQDAPNSPLARIEPLQPQSPSLNSPSLKSPSLKSPSLQSSAFAKAKSYSPQLDSDLFTKPQAQSNQFDSESIGSFSPDTPPTRKPHTFQLLTPTGDDEDDENLGISNNLTHLRRSVILDRLNQMTSDIQEQLRLDHYGSSKEISGQEDSEEEEEESENGNEDVESMSEGVTTNDTITSVPIIVPSSQVEDDNVKELSKEATSGEEYNHRDDSVKFGTSKEDSLESINPKDNSFHSNTPNDKSFDSATHKDNSFDSTTSKDNSFGSNSLKDNSFGSNSHTDDSFHSSTHRDNSFDSDTHKDSIHSDTHKDISIHSETHKDSHIQTDSLIQSDSHVVELANNSFTHCDHGTTTAENSLLHSEKEDSMIKPLLVGEKQRNLNTEQNPYIVHELEDPFVLDEPYVESIKIEQNSDHEGHYNYIDREDDAYDFADEEDGNDDDDDQEDDDQDDDDCQIGEFSNTEGEITPLTSMNSLNNGNFSLSTPTGYSKTSTMDRRKSKPVHDMFIPILGKFDELAEKLAELEGML